MEEIIKLEQNNCEIVATSDKMDIANNIANDEKTTLMFDAIICW